jgi:hypothetical protein
MSNKLQVWLKKVNLKNTANEAEPSILIKDSINMTSIVEAMLNDGVVCEKDKILKIINQFNQKTAELVAAGNIVDTGLVKLNAEINGTFYNNRWNPTINKISAKVEPSSELKVTFANTFVEIVEDYTDTTEPANLHEGTSIHEDQVANPSRIHVSNPLFDRNEVPACGMAFREWLLHS